MMECPEKVCVWWAPVGSMVNLDMVHFNTVEEMENSGLMYEVEFEGCHCPFGKCIRQHPDEEEDFFMECP